MHCSTCSIYLFILGTIAVDKWYDEIKYYDFDDGRFSSATGHFSQVVWNASQRLGVGFATKKSPSKHELYIVAHYSPRGNEAGRFAMNVFSDQC
jgi:glioma pathogenesis-related protein 2